MSSHPSGAGQAKNAEKAKSAAEPKEREAKVTVPAVRAMKAQGRRIAMVTAYDYVTGRLVDEAGADIALVGDSLAMVVLGHETTLPVTVDEMLHHTRAVRRGVKRALLVADMPFGSFQGSPAEAVNNAARFLKEAGAEAVKLEGGIRIAETVRQLTQAGIPVMGHLGLTPQSVLQYGGFKVQGREEAQRRALVEDARALEEAGVFSIVLEGIPADLARVITETVSVPTIGIGAGPHCDGQVLVVHDLLGLVEDFQPKFVKRYAELAKEARRAIEAYCREVREGLFPTDEHSYH